MIAPVLHHLATEERHIHHELSWHGQNHHDHACELCGVQVFENTVSVQFKPILWEQKQRFEFVIPPQLNPFVKEEKARAPPKALFAMLL